MWVEGLTNSQRILFTLANILTTANKKLTVKYRKTVNGVPTDFILTESTPGVWKDKDGLTVDIQDYTQVDVPTNEIDPAKNWQVVYATGGSTDLAQMELNLLNYSDKWEKVNGFDAKRVILKTITTPVQVNAAYDEYNTDPDSKVDRIEMFLELIKYKYAINPEENLEETVDPVTGEILKMSNNHYIELRYSDKMAIDRQYVIDKVTKTEQPDLAVQNGIICSVTTDEQTQLPIYTPLDDTEAALYDIVIVYGNHFLSKEEGGHPSEYAKFSWYVDYKEELVDARDGGPSTDDISKGIALVPQILSGMSETIPIQFWINCNNDRVSMVLMGDPTIDYDRYLTSFAYIGKVDSFEGDGVVNDTAGNFGLTVGSATVPCKRPKPLSEPISGKVEVTDVATDKQNILEINNDGIKATKTLPAGGRLDGYYIISGLPTTQTAVGKIDYVTKYRGGYKFIAYTADDESNASADLDFTWVDEYVTNAGVPGTWNGATATGATVGTKVSVSGANFSIKLKIPKSSNGNAPSKLKVFKGIPKIKQNNVSSPDAYVYGTTDPLYLFETIDLTAVTGVVDPGPTFNYVEYTWTVKAPDAEAVATVSKDVMPLVKSSSITKSVERDIVLNFVLSVKFPDTWGDETTATGVTDISMFKTRSGVYNQRHYSSFITPEEYMRKDAFNPSRWTGKFHLSPTYVVHGYDGYRGWLKDTVIVDNTSIVHLDELIVNKDSKDKEKPQEIFKYFKLNSPFCFLNNSPNFNYGVGILKSRSYIDSHGNRIELY